MNLSDYGCEKDSNYSILTPSYNDGLSWVKPLIEKLQKHRGGCIIYADSSVVLSSDYLKALSNWAMVSKVITNRLRDMESEGIQPGNIFMYGFSLGARIVIDAAIQFGKQKIGLIDGKRYK